MPENSILEFATKTAKEAGNIIIDFLNKPYEISFKEGNERNIVTAADHASEKFIIEKIHQTFPKHQILAEESGSSTQVSDYLWIIDPIDGTNNFSHTNPFFSISIGISLNNELIAGIVHCPMFNETFTASKNQGAFLNNAKIKVSQVTQLKKSLLTTGFPPANRAQNLPYFTAMLEKSQGIRRTGSAAIDLCYVASGRIDGFWEFGLSPWDIAAGALIITEAGGKVTNFNSTPLDIHAKNILATNGKIHEEITQEFSKIKTTPSY